MDLKTAKVLITGGTQGIGLDTAKILQQAGAQVCVVSRNEENVSKVSELNGLIGIVGDVSSEESVGSFFKQASKSMSGLNVVVNNAAYGYMAPLVDIDAAKFNQLLATNLTGAMMVAREAAKYFVAQRAGNLINISSTAGLAGYPGGSPYVATKYALKGMTECWRKELREHNIRTILINPSEVQTNFVVNSNRPQRTFNESKLVGKDIAQTIKSVLELDDHALVTEVTVWATNPQ